MFIFLWLAKIIYSTFWLFINYYYLFALMLVLHKSNLIKIQSMPVLIERLFWLVNERLVVCFLIKLRKTSF